MSDLRTLRDRPMELLRAMERRLAGSDAQVVLGSNWAGIAMRLGDQRFLVAQDHIREIVELPGYSRGPGGKPWLMGVANIRGELLPIINLKGMLLDAPTALGLNSRILVLKHPQFPAGFLVDRVEGLRRFDQGQKQALAGAELPAACSVFVNGWYGDGTQSLPVLDLYKLVEDPIFQMAA